MGKIMSEAAHSIIGMLSAKPGSMEHRTSNSDFGSFLQSPEEQPHSEADRLETGVPEGTIILNDADSSITHNMGGTIGLPNVFPNLVAPAARERSPLNGLEPQANHDKATTAAGTNIVPARTNIDGLAGATKDLVGSFGPSPQPDIRSSGINSPIDGMLRSKRAGLVGDVRPAVERATSEQQAADFSSQISKAVRGETVKDVLVDEAMPVFPFTKPSVAQARWTAAPLAAAPTSQSGVKASGAGSQPFDASRLDTKALAKSSELPLDQSAVPTLATQSAVREPAQAAVSFDLSAPRIAERLASEIAVLTANGETKKFEINPRNLGRMEIMLTTRGSTEIIEIQTEHRSAKDIIVQHSQALQDMLKSQGREDLTFRVDVKENMSASSRGDSGNQFQQESRDTREHQSRSARPGRTLAGFNSGSNSDPAPDNSRYA